MPNLMINTKSIQYNIRYLKVFCENRKIELVGVIKSCQQSLPIVQIFQKNGINSLGVSDSPTAKKLRKKINADFFLLSIPSPHDALDVVTNCKISLNSEIETIKALAAAAKKINVLHEIILMIDIGDLREGVLPEDAIETVRTILASNFTHLKLAGIGANLACCSGKLPSSENITLLHNIALHIENKLHYPIEKISIGGSVMLDWMKKNTLPHKTNQLRIGEAILLGTIPGIDKKYKQLKNDTFTFVGKILEIKSKPSMPTGKIGRDAFGLKPKLKDNGIRKRAVVNFGTIHTVPKNLIPIIENAKLISSNSNYSVYDVTDCIHEFQVGDSIEFRPTYAPLVQSLLSPYVKQHIIL